ncbi:ricin-type beta-trefoil lectin domain protein [Streptomyces sp. NPDC059193]|uniref:ricin-type beta-trefoil lectin domain protein n=1 Tax=Streptomyces sp. NPDC059193 TaxID=3346763 RepID=UPI0036C4625A
MKVPGAAGGRRRRRLSAAVVAAALGAGIAVPLALAPAAVAADAPGDATARAEAAAREAAARAANGTPANGTPAGGASADAAAKAEAGPGEARASEQAQASGKPVEVAEQRDEYTQVIANPDGSFTWKQYVRPAFTKVDGTWQNTDATLEETADGRITPAAATFGISFSGGGTTPLATLQREGKTMSLSWPDALPEPRIEGETALYPEVLPGVDLKLVAAVDGFAQHLVVKTPEAAKNPRLAKLTFGLKNKGLGLKADAKGALKAVDTEGDALFSAPTPAMWDSSHLSTTEAAELTAGGTPEELTPPARSADMGAKVTGDSLTITPDTGMLTDPKTVFPVVIDPIFSGGNRVNWAMAYKQDGTNLANTAYWNGGSFTDKLARVGHETQTNGTARSFFQLNTNGLAGARIISATFNVFNTYSWSCTATPVELGWTGPIGTGTTWNSQPSWNRTLQTKSFAHGWGDSCKAAGEDFAAGALKDLVQDVANGGGTDLTLGLRSAASHEGSASSWKKFQNNPHLEVTYNRVPKVDSSAFYQGPYSPGGSGNKQVACSSDPATWPTVGRADLALTAKLSDPDGGNLTAAFELWEYGGATVASPRANVASGGSVVHVVDINTLTEGKRYKWFVRAEDGTDVSGYTPQCGFNVDKTAPPKPTVASADGLALDVASAPARTERKVKFTSKDPLGGVDGFCYSLNTPLPVANDKCAGGTFVKADANGSATVSLKPSLWPNNRLHVQAYDLYGNTSLYDGNGPATDTTLIVTQAPAFVRTPDGRVRGDLPGDLNGDGHVDLVATDDTGKLILYPGKGDGRHTDGQVLPGLGEWNGAQIAHRGDVISAVDGQTKDGYEDYFARIGNKLYLYPGDGNGAPIVGGRKELIHPTGKDSGPLKGAGDKCVDVANSATANGTAIQYYVCNGTTAQQFQLTGKALKVLGKCVDVPWGRGGNGTQVQLFDCNGSPAQHWVDRGDGSLLNPVTGLCFDLPGANTANGTRLAIYQCNGTGAQQWNVPGSWAGASGIMAPGNSDGMPGNDLIVIEGNGLVHYTGTIEGPLAMETGTYKLKPGKNPGGSGWGSYDVVALGDVNGDAVPDLMGRWRGTDTANGEYGKLWLYPGVQADDGQGGTDYRIGNRSQYGGAGSWHPGNVLKFAGAANVQGQVVDQGTYKQFVPTAGQETADFWATLGGGTSGTGVLRFYPGTPTLHGSPTVVGDGSWATRITGIF